MQIEDIQETITQEQLLQMKRGANRFIQQINELLDIEKYRAQLQQVEDKETPCTATDIERLAKTQLQLSCEEKDIRYTVTVDKLSQVAFWMNKPILERIFEKVIDNAANYTPEGGSITFTAETVSGTNYGITNQYTITDTGCGMTEEFCRKALLPFSREKNEVNEKTDGLGLGLYIVDQLVCLLHGTIQIQPNHPTGIRVIMQIAGRTNRNEIEPQPTKKVVRKAMTLPGKRFLLCEDNELNGEMTKELLEKNGVIVDWAKNGLEAVKLIEASRQYYYDAVLMDIKMPIMDGLEATKVIRGMKRSDTIVLPIAALTANVYDEEHKKSIAAGMDAHLTKPFNIEMLIQQISDIWFLYQEEKKENHF